MEYKEGWFPTITQVTDPWRKAGLGSSTTPLRFSLVFPLLESPQSILFPLPPTGLFIESVNPRSVYFASSGKLTSTLGNSSCSLTSNLSPIKFFAQNFFQTTQVYIYKRNLNIDSNFIQFHHRDASGETFFFILI